jgi:hypothetical protein
VASRLRSTAILRSELRGVMHRRGMRYAKSLFIVRTTNEPEIRTRCCPASRVRRIVVMKLETCTRVASSTA